MANPLLQLKDYGQSVWYDNIDRAQLEAGEFKRLLEEDGITGSQPTPPSLTKPSAVVTPTMPRSRS